MAVYITQRLAGRIVSVSFGFDRSTDDGQVRISIVGSAAVSTRPGVPASVSGDSNRFVSQFGDELFPWTGTGGS